jgi:NAD-dependent dihydropyrimidine dehydrogenase PreA subunit
MRKIISIDRDMCMGCSACIPECRQGALIFQGVARLVEDWLCDGFGECVEVCPGGAISLVEREAEPYDEFRVMEHLTGQGQNAIEEHLRHLQKHDQAVSLQQAAAYISEREIKM